jgi:hypothetical protein
LSSMTIAITTEVRIKAGISYPPSADGSCCSF